MQEKWDTTRCIYRKYMRRNILFLGNNINSESRFHVHVWSFSPLVQLLWSKIFANASTFIIKLHGNMWNTIYKTALLQHNSHNTSVQHFMDTTIIPTIYKEDRDHCHQALPCYVIDPCHKLCCKYWGTTAVQCTGGSCVIGKPQSLVTDWCRRKGHTGVRSIPHKYKPRIISSYLTQAI